MRGRNGSMGRRSSPRMASSEEFVMSSRYSRYSKWVWTIGLIGLSTAAFADDPKPRPPQEPAGFVAGAVVGAFAAGPIALVASNQPCSPKLHDLSQSVQTAQTAKEGASEVLDGLQGDVLFRTGSAEITPDIAHQIQVLAQAVSKSPEIGR